MIKYKSLKFQLVAAAYGGVGEGMKACHLNFILLWKSLFLEQGECINIAAVPAEGNGWFVKAVLTARVQEMESQQDKPHLQALAKMAPSASEKITYKQFAVCTLAAHFIHAQSAQSGGKYTVIIETVQLVQARPPNAPCGSFRASGSAGHDFNTNLRVAFTADPKRCKFSTSCDFFFPITDFWDVSFIQEIVLPFFCDFSWSK